MTTLLIIVAVVLAVIAAIYIYAAVAYYYGFKSWVPFCGCKNMDCSPGKPA